MYIDLLFFQMMHPVFSSVPLNLMPVYFPKEECVLDLRVPEKQKTNSVDYTLTYPSPNVSPVHESSPKNDQNSSFLVGPASCLSPQVTTVRNNSPAHSCPSPQMPKIHNKSFPLGSPLNVLPGCESPTSTVSSSDSMQNADVSSRSGSKPTRPFKTLTKDPFIGIKTAMNLLHEDVDYATFREKMLSQARQEYNNTNMNMKRKSVSNENNSDPTYWEKRKKNNEAAKKSRDARKAREDEIAIRCAFLEQENLKLKLKIAAVQSDTEKLQNIIYRV